MPTKKKKAPEKAPRLQRFDARYIPGYICVPITKQWAMYPADIPDCFFGPYRSLIHFVVELPDYDWGKFNNGLRRLKDYLDAVMAAKKKYTDEIGCCADYAPTWLKNFVESEPGECWTAEDEELEDTLRDIDEALDHVEKKSRKEVKLWLLRRLLDAEYDAGVVNVLKIIDLYRNGEAEKIQDETR